MNDAQRPEKDGGTLRSIEDLIRQQLDVLERSVRPYILVDVYPRFFVNALYFRIRNVGQTPAYNIRLTVDPPVEMRGTSSNDLPIFCRPIPALGPAEEISFFFNTATALFAKDSVRQFTVTVSYEDEVQREYERALGIDLDLLRGLAIEMPSAGEIRRTLDKIEKNLDKMSRYFERLRQKEVMEEHRKMQEGTETLDQGNDLIESQG